MSPEISERAFEEAIECALLENGPDADGRQTTMARETPPPYGEVRKGLPADGLAKAGGYRRRRAEDFDRALCLLTGDVVDFVLVRTRFGERSKPSTGH